MPHPPGAAPESLTNLGIFSIQKSIGSSTKIDNNEDDNSIYNIYYIIIDITFMIFQMYNKLL